MQTELISQRVRHEVREYFVGTTLAHIGDVFGAEGFSPDTRYDPQEPGQRRRYVEQFYHRMDWTERGTAERFLRVCEHVLGGLDDAVTDGGMNARQAASAARRLRKLLERDGVSEGKAGLALPPADGMEPIREVMSAPELQRQSDRLRGAVDRDPSLAIGTAKELLETVCKTILGDRRVEVAADWDTPRLVKETMRKLRLVPPDVDNPVKGAAAVRRVLSALSGVASGVAEVRNLYGTGHGKHGAARGIEPRHARLAVGAVTTLARFLIDTHMERV